MKSIVEHINDAMALNEGRTVFSEINTDWDDDSYEVYAPEAISDCYGLATGLEDAKLADLKKVRAFKTYDNATLEDYCTLLSDIGAWINGIMSLAEDDLPDAGTYVSMTQFLGEDPESCIESVADNHGDLNTIEDGEDVYDFLKDIFDHWNDISKVLFKKPWN